MAENNFVSYEQTAFEFFLKEIDNHFHYVVEKLLGWGVPQEVRFRTGTTSVVIKFRFGNDYYIFRVPKFGRFQIRISLLAHQHFANSGLMPEKIYHDERCIIERFVEGRRLKNNCGEAEIKKLGVALCSLHQIPSSGFDCVMHEKEGAKRSLNECFSSYVTDGLLWLRRNHIMDEERFHHLEGIMQEMPESVDKQPRLCHGDMSPGNIMITDAAAVFIDWDCLSSFPREYDFSYLNADPEIFPFMDQLIADYGMPVNRNLINYFSFCNILRMITTAGDPYWEMWKFCDVFDNLLLQM